MLVTLVLVVAVIFLFLHNGSATLIPALALPFSILGTFAVMQLLGFTLDNLSMMALILSIGFVVDDAIVMLENIVRHMELGESPLEASLNGSKEIGFTIVSMTVSLAAVFIPDPVHERHPGPAVPGIRRHDHGRDPDFRRRVGDADADAVQPLSARERAPRRRAASPASWSGCSTPRTASTSAAFAWRCVTGPRCSVVFVAVLAATVRMFAIVPKGFIPDQDNDSMNINLRAAQGTSYYEMVKNARQVAEIVSRNPYVDTFFVSTGGGTSAMNTARLNIQLTPRRTRPLTAAQVAQQLRPQLSRFPGFQAFISLPPAIQIGGRQANSSYTLTVESADYREPVRLGAAPGTRDREAAGTAGRLGRHGSEEPARGPRGRPRRRGRRRA